MPAAARFPNILVVDDHLERRAGLTYALRACGANVAGVASVLAGVDQLAEEATFDLVLVAEELVTATGFRTLAKAHRLNAASRPITAMLVDDTTRRRKPRGFGVDRYVHRPATIEDTADLVSLARKPAASRRLSA